jgi:hypothetical protein
MLTKKFIKKASIKLSLASEQTVPMTAPNGIMPGVMGIIDLKPLLNKRILSGHQKATNPYSR